MMTMSKAIPVMKRMMTLNKFIRNFILFFCCRKIIEIMGVKELMDQKIANKKVFVISKSYCPFCVKAKKILQKYNIPADNMEIQEIENDKDCNEIQDYMRQLTGGRSVPRVFIGGKFIGGGDETEAAHKAGKLQGMLESAGAV